MTVLNLNKKQQTSILNSVTHVGALLPLAYFGIGAFAGWLGVDPIRTLIFDTGYVSLVLLVLSLACTPFSLLFGWNKLLVLRKPLGLYAFMYVFLHFAIWAGLDYGLNVALIVREGILNQPFVLVGFLAFLLLIPLAATSNRWAMRKLGKSWKRLHRLAYLIGVLAIIHYFWLVKNIYTEPIIFAIVLGLLFLVRWSPVKTRIVSWRRDFRKRQLARKTAVSAD